MLLNLRNEDTPFSKDIQEYLTTYVGVNCIHMVDFSRPGYIYVYMYFSTNFVAIYKNWLPDFVGVIVVISVLDINEMFGRKLDGTGKLDKVAVESTYICMLSIYTWLVHH